MLGCALSRDLVVCNLTPKVSILQDQHSNIENIAHHGPTCTFQVVFVVFNGCQIFRCFMNSFKLIADNYVLPFLSRCLLHL